MTQERKPILELGIEFIIEILLFAFPYGAEQMGLPHSFFLGLSCWVIATAIALRMFWIFPIWVDRRTRLEKGLITFIILAAFVAVFYGPITTAYHKQKLEAETKASSPPVVPPTEAEKPKSAESSPVTQPAPALQKTIKTRPSVQADKSSNGQNNSGGTNTQQSGQGNVSAPFGIALGPGATALSPSVTNNFGDKYPRPGVTPAITFCVSYPPNSPDENRTIITFNTDTRITAPFWALVFDGPVLGADLSYTRNGIELPNAMNQGHPDAATGLPPPETILRIQVTRGNPMGGVVAPWEPNETIKFTVKSKQPAKLKEMRIGYGVEWLATTMQDTCAAH